MECYRLPHERILSSAQNFPAHFALEPVMNLEAFWVKLFDDAKEDLSQ
jgi:hypothetical protein